MKLVWHIGPHKTGTTSLQMALQRRAESGLAGYYYAPTPVAGPGHAEVAWRLLGLNGMKREVGAISEVIERAAAAGFNKVVVSSEEFARGLLTRSGRESLSSVCASVTCELVVTLRPLADRVMPEMQELIKHGRSIDVADPVALLDAMSMRPGLRPEFLSRALLGLHADAASVIFVNGREPGRLFEAMSDILQEALPPPERTVVNRSYPYLKTAWWSALNQQVSSISRPDKRAIIDAAFAAAVKLDGSLADTRYPPMPPALDEYVRGVWELQLRLIEVLKHHGAVRCFCEPESTGDDFGQLSAGPEDHSPACG